MNLANHVLTVDSHVMGEPLRAVIGGLPFLKGSSIAEKKEYFARNLDHIRSALILEPRGHDNMFGAVLCEPVNTKADAGVFFMHSDGYLNMCGHGTIGAVTTIIEMGLLPRKTERLTELILETPAGLIYARALVEEGKVKAVTFRNIPSFVLYNNMKVTLPDIGDICVDIAYGGNFFGLVSAAELAVEIKKENISQLISYGMKIRKAINENVKIYHPYNKNLNKVELVEIYETGKNKLLSHRNCVVFGHNQVDRSPCGSGTSAMLALKYHNKEIALNQTFTNESIIGTRFTARAVEAVKVGDIDGIVAEVQGTAYITGNNHFIIDDNDPLSKGITLNY